MNQQQATSNHGTPSFRQPRNARSTLCRRTSAATIGICSFLAGVVTTGLFHEQIELIHQSSAAFRKPILGMQTGTSNNINLGSRWMEATTDAAAVATDGQQTQPESESFAQSFSSSTTKNGENKNEQENTFPGGHHARTAEPLDSSYWNRLEFPFDLSKSFLTTPTNKNNNATGDGNNSDNNEKPAILPFGLSVNHLQRIELAGGAIAKEIGAPEDFLPVVLSNAIQLRFRLRPAAGAAAGAVQDIRAIQIRAAHAHAPDILLWDSGPQTVATMPDHVPWGGPMLSPGTIVAWTVAVWDFNHIKATSAPSKFAVGPSDDEFQGEWIVHPTDQATFQENEIQEFWEQTTPKGCRHWKARRPLPLARTKFELSKKEANDIASAMLVVSGLGAFSASMDGKLLSSSSAMDPPLTEFTKRISYRGYDVTDFVSGKEGSHVVGVTLGSGWFDARPMEGGIIKHKLLPRGPLATVAELRVTMKNGETKILGATNGKGDWQMAKGFLLDSDLFTGDVTHLGRKKVLDGWDAPTGWNKATRLGNNSTIQWVLATPYSSNIDTDQWRKILTGRAVSDAPDEPAQFDASPLGKLIPIEAPPVMPVETLPVESMQNLGNGRWLLDFGKAISGVVRFDDGLPEPMKNVSSYPRAHTYPTNDAFMTVVYGESIQIETGDINLVLVAGMGLHDGGFRHNNTDVSDKAGPCYPDDHGPTLAQRDVFVAPKGNLKVFSEARKSSFTTHAFRFVEVCCSAKPPTNVQAVMYRSAFEEWGKFDSSNVNLNGAHELVRNAFNSNFLGVQSDCPHREKLQYGGDVLANSPTALHLYDLGAFYNKIIHDWTDSQWSNGAYTETTPWHDLNEWAGIGYGAGETVWASLPAVLSVRHMQHYGEMQLLEKTMDQHISWMRFLQRTWPSVNWDMQPGLGDWLAINQADTYFTHHAFFMATARSVAYVANQLREVRNDTDAIIHESMAIANRLRDELVAKYMPGHNGNAFSGLETPNADLGLYARIVPGQLRCAVMKHWLAYTGSGGRQVWPGDEEQLFFKTLKQEILDEFIREGLAIRTDNGKIMSSYTMGTHTPEGILSIRYTLKTLSDIGFHNIALQKIAGGKSIPSIEYMLSHNATTLWETWWRSEDVYSRNHPMLGGLAEWLTAAVAGVSLAPRATGGKQVLFWPRLPTVATSPSLEHASATQGTKRGDATIAWKFVSPSATDNDKNVTILRNVEIRLLVPPSSTAILRLPIDGILGSEGGRVKLTYAQKLPDLEQARHHATNACQKRRARRQGFGYNWEYDRTEGMWDRATKNSKSIGTPCESYLFEPTVDAETVWSEDPWVLHDVVAESGTEVLLVGGLYQVTITSWSLLPEPEDVQGDFVPESLGSVCSDSETYDWDLFDATHMI